MRWEQSIPPCNSVWRGCAGGDGSRFSDRVAVDNQFDAAIALAALDSVIGGYRLCFTKATRSHCADGNAFFGKVVANGIRAALGELLIEIVGANAVRVAFDLQRQAFVGEEYA